MDFDLSEEQTLVLESVRRLALELKKTAPERDRRAQLDLEATQAVEALGLYGLTVPADAGGAGLPLVTAVLVIEALARHDPAVAHTLSVHLTSAWPLLEAALGDPGLILADGGPVTVAWLEAARFQPEQIATSATATAGGYTLDGHKPWVALGASGRPIWVVASSAGELGLYLVSPNAPGLSRQVTDALGLRGAAFAHLGFSGVPAQKIGGPLNAALPRLLASARLGAAAVAVGVGRAALEEARAYALERRQFNQPIADFQAIQWMLADLATENDGARLLALSAAAVLDRGEADHGRAARAKVRALEAGIDAAMKAIQIFGGNGYVREYPVERQLRDISTLAGLPPTREPDRVQAAEPILRGAL